MGNNFEAKHPRAKDGKFTEKLRKESGLTLGLEQHSFTPPDTPKDCEREEVFVGKEKRRYFRPRVGLVTEYECPDHGEISGDNWWLFEKIEHTQDGDRFTYRTQDGYVGEICYESGALALQRLLDKDFKQKQDRENWTEKFWHENGQLRSHGKKIYPENEKAVKLLKADIAGSDTEIIEHEWFDQQGNISGRQCIRSRSGEIYHATEHYFPDGQVSSMRCCDIHGGRFSPEDEPTYLRCDQDGLQFAEYLVPRGDWSVYHRTDGPALIDNSKPEGERERYFLEGKEYTKAEWEKKVGR